MEPAEAERVVEAVAKGAMLSDIEERGVPEGLPALQELIRSGAICVLAYARISDVNSRKQEDGRKHAKGVSNQHVELRKGAVEHGVVIVKRYTDNDLSASKDAYRPDYEAMLTDLLRGFTAEGYPVHGVICVEEERIFKTPAQWGRFMEAFRSQPGRFFADEYGALDLYSDAADYIGLIKVATFMGETRKKKARTARWHRGQARRGIAHSGGRVFGYQTDDAGTTSVIPEEAALIAKAAKLAAEGKGLGSITLMFQESGIPPLRGGAWCLSSVRRMLTNPRYARLRVLGEDLVTGEDGHVVLGGWPEIFSREAWELHVGRWPSKPYNRASNSGGPKPEPRAIKYELAGLLRCGNLLDDGRPCNQKMAGKRHDLYGHIYNCHSRASGGCGGTSIQGPWIEKRVAEALFQAIENRPVVPVDIRWDQEDGYQAQISKRDRLRTNWALGEVSDEQFYPLEKLLNDQVKKLEKERAAFLQKHARPTDTLTDMRRKWFSDDPDDSYDLVQKRKVLFGWIEAVQIDRIGKGRKKRPEDSYRIVFRSEASEVHTEDT
jgi:DNA invertase Pin-like site-specific DNA recombinase